MLFHAKSTWIIQGSPNKSPSRLTNPRIRFSSIFQHGLGWLKNHATYINVEPTYWKYQDILIHIIMDDGFYILMISPYLGTNIHMFIAGEKWRHQQLPAWQKCWYKRLATSTSVMPRVF